MQGGLRLNDIKRQINEARLLQYLRAKKLEGRPTMAELSQLFSKLGMPQNLLHKTWLGPVGKQLVAELSPAALQPIH